MKTKYLLTAMLLPAAFAACTNEDVLVENPNVLEDRPVVDFKVAATYGAEGTESRMVNNNGTFLWEGTDVLGATWNRITRNAETGDVISAEIFSNNKFVNTLTAASASADFTTQATTVVGDYVFYYPYNTDVTKDLASGIVYSLPEPQEYDPTGDKMMNNNFMISPNVKVDGNEPGELTLPLTLRSIYGYGLLNLKLSDGLYYNGSAVSSVNIQKIIISYTSNVAKDGKIALANIPTVNLNADYIESLIAGESEDEDLNEACVGKTEAEVRAILFDAADKALTAQTDNYGGGTVLDLTEGDNKIGQVSITCVSDENPNGVKLNLNSTFSTRVLLPTANSANVTVTVYTDKGYWTTTMAGQKIKANHTANLANLNRQNNGQTSLMINDLEPVSGVITTISEADFIATVKNLTDDAAINVGDFTLTPAAIAAIPENVKLTFNSVVKFEGDMTLKNMEFSVAAALKKGDIVLGDNITSKYLQVNGANATIISSDFIDNASGTNSIDVYDGTLKIAALDEDGEAAAVGITAINVLSVEEGKTPGIVVETEVNGEITVGKDATLTNKSDIEQLQVNNNAVVSNEGVLGYAGVNASEAVLNNAGTIKAGANKGTINQQTNGVILAMNNHSKVVTVANSEITTTQAEDAEVIYVEGARVAATRGHVTYVAPADFTFDGFKTLNDCVTKVLFENDVTYAPSSAFVMSEAHKSVKTLEFKGNLTITTNKGVTLKEDTELIFTGASSTIKSASVIKNVATIKVGVADDESTEDIDETVATNVTIVKGTEIEGFKSAIFYGGAQIWNEGRVVYPYNTTYSISGEGTWKNVQPEEGAAPTTPAA